jgi:hypothetical protein
MTIGSFGAMWGVLGVALLLVSAAVRLASVALEALSLPLAPVHLIVLVAVVALLAYFEGYRAFQRGFSPRVVARAYWLRRYPAPLRVALAPLFCMGFFHTTRRRQLTAFAVTGGIVLLVVLVRLLPQPWRGIVDAGVVVALAWGLSAIIAHGVAVFVLGSAPSVSADVPEQTPTRAA